MNIRTRLAAAFAGLALIVLIVALIALSALGSANDRFESYVNGSNSRGAVATRLRAAVDQRAIAARNLVLVTKASDMQSEKDQVDKAHAQVVASLAKLNDMIAHASDVGHRDRDLVSEMDRIEGSYASVALGIVDLALKGKKEEAIAKMNDECRPLLAALGKASDEYAEYTDSRAHELIAEAAAAYGVRRNLLVAACLLAIAAAAAAGLLITRSITRPIDRAVELAESVAAGDLSRRVEATGDNEVSKLLAALGRMSLGLEGIVSQVRQSTDSIATGSSQIASGNADLSRRTEIQASALQQTAATMDELGATVRNNAENAKQANRMSSSASEVAGKGGEVVRQVVEKMKGINDSSRKIAEIIGVIDGIAFQTNILALNASVEAARAGDQGRGFAVVASEVRSLAQRSAAAAKEIKTLITDSVEQVEQGSTLVAKAGETMTEIVGAIRRVTDVVGEISAASVEQSAGVSQVGQAVTQMDHATQQNAALVEQSAAAAESLRQQAERLVQAVSIFKLAEAAETAQG